MSKWERERDQKKIGMTTGMIYIRWMRKWWRSSNFVFFKLIDETKENKKKNIHTSVEVEWIFPLENFVCPTNLLAKLIRIWISRKKFIFCSNNVEEIRKSNESSNKIDSLHCVLAGFKCQIYCVCICHLCTASCSSDYGKINWHYFKHLPSK